MDVHTYVHTYNYVVVTYEQYDNFSLMCIVSSLATSDTQRQVNNESSSSTSSSTAVIIVLAVALGLTILAVTIGTVVVYVKKRSVVIR